MMPFPGGIEATANGAFVISVAAAIVNLLVGESATSWRRILLAALPAAALAVLAITTRGALLLAVALLFAAAGDALMSRESRRTVCPGIAVLIAAHVAYAALFLSSGTVGSLASERLLLAAGFLALGLATAAAIARRSGREERIPILAAGLVAAATAVLSLFVPDMRVWAGALLLLVSDALVAAGYNPIVIPGRRDTVRRGGFLLRYLGQLSITLGFLLS
jgi:uncharacterized membrane protein YhhN